jgi:flagellin
MAFSVNTNITSLQAQEYLRLSSDFQSKTINRVTSGLRIVQSGDDAAGLAIANGFRSDQAVLTQGVRNANDGLSTLQTIDGGMSNISKLLDRARTLATQSASGTFNGDRSVLNDEFASVMTEIDRQAKAVGLNGGGDFARSLSVFVGGGRANSSEGANAKISNGTVSVDLGTSTVDTGGLGLKGYAVQGKSNLNLSETGAVSTALSGATSFTFNLVGSGFTGGVAVTVNANNVTDLDGLVNALNSGLASAGADNSAYKQAAFSAAKTADGTSFSITSASGSFMLTTTGGVTATNNLFGTSANDIALTAKGGHSTTLDFAALGAGEEQMLTLSAVDASGTLQKIDIALDAGGGTNKAAAITAINTALQNSGIDALKNIVAAGDTKAGAADTISFVSTKSFNVTLGVSTDGTGLSHADDGQGTTTVATAPGSSDAVSLDISNASSAQTAVTALGAAVETLGKAQAVVGKGQNQFSYAINLAQSQLGNLAAAESRIRDADLANEAANLTKAQILLQAGVAALAQANSAPQQILSLLRG